MNLLRLSTAKRTFKELFNKVPTEVDRKVLVDLFQERMEDENWDTLPRYEKYFEGWYFKSYINCKKNIRKHWLKDVLDGILCWEEESINEQDRKRCFEYGLWVGAYIHELYKRKIILTTEEK